ncbi:BTAD domain-containing putative transcriptional regulator [Prauserella alba]|uniref:OmpR/PhoB-type domain-containing protein n=1 Tax=Prauserella alba TaxID=176898 RepID=A0ABN1VTY5_9PSEU|nr:BTAD domain-containing putative transcriptional regulator [Prauserella alba]MCP2179509.1 DNA-binding transcriptional activator of the SARP family [Prauserella alba]
MTSIDIGMLGELDVRVAGAPVLIPGGKQRLLLAALTLRAGRLLTTEELIDRVWGEEPPETARTTLRGYVKRLRTGFSRAGTDTAIEAVSGGYRLCVCPEDIDLERFRALRREAAEVSAPATAWRNGAGEPAADGVPPGRRGHAEELRRLQDALARWRGRALSGLEPMPWVVSAADAAEEEYLQVCERRAELRLELGEAERAVSELRPLTTAHPHRESLWTRLLLALHHSGRTAEALLTYDEVRRMLADGLGVEPCASLRGVHERLLREDGPQRAPSVGSRRTAPAPPATAPATPTRPGETRPGEVPPETGQQGGDHGPATGAVVTVDTVAAAAPGSVSGPTAAADAPHPLPGRQRELAVLDGALGPGRARLVVVDGPGGVGKTALVSHWVRSAATETPEQNLPQPRFPGGVLHVDLRGFDPEPPLTAAEALTDLLVQAGCAVSELPADPLALAALLRRATARNRTLVVLDNARDAAQVRPLLPGGTSAAVVTSQNQLRGLVARDGAVRVSVRPLGPQDGARVLATLTGVTPGDPADLYELVDLCDGLPLALRIVAGDLAEDLTHGGEPDPALLAGRLAAEATRLDQLDAGDAATNMRAVLTRAHAQLTPAQAELLHVLAAGGKLDFDVDDVAGLTGRGRNEARTLVRGLVMVNLVAQRGPDTFRLGDLHRLAAVERRQADVR